MKLHGNPLSNNVFRPLVIARHLGLDIEVVQVDLMKGEHKGPEYRKLNPYGRIPVLVDGDYTLWESVAIGQYLAGKKADPIWPDDHQARATITSWQVWGVAHLARGVGPVQWNRFFKAMMGLDEADEAAVAAGIAAYEPEAAVLEDRLAANDGWLVGHGLTLADYDVGGWFLHAKASALPVGPATTAWFDKLSALPAWSAARG